MAEAASKGRDDEFSRVALPHLDALYGLALRLTHDAQDAEDLVQETFLRAYRYFDQYSPGTRIKAWLFRILRNAFINRYRARKIRPAEVGLEAIEGGYEGLVDAIFLGEHQPRTPEKVLLDASFDEEVERALAALPEEYRTVVLLALVEDLSYREIASVLSIPVGTVMSRLHRGRRALQSALLEYAREQGILRGARDVAPRGDRTP